MYRSRCHCALSNAPVLGRLGIYNFRGLFARAFWLVVLIAALCSTAKGQAIGYVLNSGEGTVTIFAASVNPFFQNQGPAEAKLATVTVCQTPLNAAATPDGAHVYVTCADNSLWVIDSTNIGQGAATAQSVPGIQLSSPGGVATTRLTKGPGATKSLAYIVNSATNTVSVIDTSNNTLYDGPIQLGTPTAPGTPGIFAGLAAAAPDSTKVFVTTNNPAPQLWMIDTTVKPETAIQIQTVSPPGIPDAVNDSLYLSVQDNHAGSTASSDYYIFLTSAFSPAVLPKPSILMLDIEPNAALGTPGSPTNALLTVAALETSMPVHVASQPTHIASATMVFDDISHLPPDPLPSPLPLGLVVYTVDQTDVWRVIFACSPSANGQGACRASTDDFSFLGSPDVVNIPVTGANLLPIAPNGLAITGVPFTVDKGTLEDLYITDGQPTGILQDQVFLDGTDRGPQRSAITAGVGALPPVFSVLSATSVPALLFSQTPAVVVPAGESVFAAAVAFVNPDNSVKVNLTFSDGTQFPSGTAKIAVGTSGSTIFDASGVYTVTIQATDSSGKQNTRTQTVYVGENCTLSPGSVSPAANTVAVGQTVTVNLSCIAPAGDSITGHLAWGDGTTSAPTNLPVTTTPSNNAVLSFSHSYSTPNHYSVSVADLFDNTESINGNTVIMQGPVTVTVNPLAVSVSPSAISVQVPSHSVSFAAAVQFDASNSGVTWSVGGTDCAGAACGTLSSVTATSVTYTAPTTKPASGVVSLTATSAASISYPDTNKSFSVPIKLTDLPPPSCTLTAPSAGQTAANITASVVCSAPAGDSLSATLSWGDGSAATTSTATVGSNGSASFAAFTHSYVTPSNPSYSIGLSVLDGTTGLAGSVQPPSVVISILQTPTIAPPASMTSVSLVAGQSTTVPFTISGGAAAAGVTFSSVTCAVAPAGPSCSVSPLTLTLDNHGNGIVQMMIATTGPAAALSTPRGGNPRTSLYAFLMPLPMFSLMLLALFLSPTRSVGSPGAVALCLLLSLSIFSVACGSTTQRSNLPCTSCTTAGSYTVTLNATSQKPALQARGTVVVVVSH